MKKTCVVRPRDYRRSGQAPSKPTEPRTNGTMAYTAYDVARQLMQVRNYVELHVSGFAEIPVDILSALLHLTAEFRDVVEMETLIKMGANPHETHEGFTVLEMFVQGHDGCLRYEDSVKTVEGGVKMLTKYGVTDKDLSHQWILSNCEEIIKNSEYLSEFFKVEKPRVNFYFHAPRAKKLTESPMTFKDLGDAVKTLHCMTDLDQYVAVLEYKGEVTRYIVTKGAGSLSVIPMESKPRWTKEQERVSNIVNFVMGRDELPTIVGEDD